MNLILLTGRLVSRRMKLYKDTFRSCYIFMGEIAVSICSCLIVVAGMACALLVSVNVKTYKLIIGNMTFQLSELLLTLRV